MLLPMNSKGVYTVPIFTAYPYTRAIFIARGTHPSTGGMGARDENSKPLHPSDIHREGYTPLKRVYRGT